MAITKSSESPSQPSLWMKAAVFFGLYWAAGLIDFLMSPGGSVQTFDAEIQYVLILFPLYAPGLAAFAIGGLTHSAIVFFTAAAASYIGTVTHAAFFFSATEMDRWFGLCAILAGGLVLAILGGTIFVNNMHGWT